jgi:exopolysaccharide biosynthesis protein
MAESGVGTAEKFSHMISRAHPYLAVTGTFFSLDNDRPVGDIVINGSLAYFGGMGTALAIKPNNQADMITVPWGHHHDWSGYNTVVACGPRLLRDGNICLDPAQEHFKDRNMLAPNSRIAVGITGHNQLVFCMTREPIYLGRLAKIMHSLGCQQAMTLDAGVSTGFYCNGNMIASPGRKLTNAIAVYTDRREETGSVPSTMPASIALNTPLKAVSINNSQVLPVADAHSITLVDSHP